VELSASAPVEPGDHLWQAAWFGSLDAGNGHTEVREAVTITVEATPVADTTWSRIHSLY
jgi:hypothetical protein